MDPVTTAIIAAIAIGAASEAAQAADQSIVGDYEALKSVFNKKFGPGNEINKAIADLEVKPDSQGRKITLEEEIVQHQAEQDSDVLQAAQKLIELIKHQPEGTQHIQIAIGNYIAQADHGGTASVRTHVQRHLEISADG